jgi:hypothetical protein
MGCCASSDASAAVLEVQTAPPAIGIPSNLRGANVEMSSGDPLTVSGQGAALASAPIEQDVAYFEVKVLQPGRISIGVARKLSAKELEAGLLKHDGEDKELPRSWVYSAPLAAGDIIGVAFSQADMPNLSFTKNGKEQRKFDVKKIGGMVYPVVSVGDGASLKCVFEAADFANSPPARFGALMVAQSVL